MAVEIWLSLSAPVSSPWTRAWQWRDSTEKKKVSCEPAAEHILSHWRLERVDVEGDWFLWSSTGKMTTDGENEQKDPVHSLCSLLEMLSSPHSLMTLECLDRKGPLLRREYLLNSHRCLVSSKRSSSTTSAPLHFSENTLSWPFVTS